MAAQQAECKSINVPRKGKKPSFNPSMDTKLVTFRTEGNKGHPAAMQLLNDVLSDRIIYS